MQKHLSKKIKLDNILILTENKFHRNLEKKFGINFLKNFYNIYLCNLSTIIKGSQINDFDFFENEFNYIEAKNLEEFCSNLKRIKFSFALDFLAYSKKAFDIRNFLQKENIKIIKNHS